MMMEPVGVGTSYQAMRIGPSGDNEAAEIVQDNEAAEIARKAPLAEYQGSLIDVQA